MGVLKGRNNSGGWSNASVVYGWNSSGVKTYAKAMFMRKADNTWERGWTDCRQHDAAGGRDWIAAPPVTEYQGSCASRESRVRTDYSKTGCTSYTRYTSWTSSPDCGPVAGSCWTDVTCNYINSTNFVFAGITFTGVFDASTGCVAYRDDNCFYGLWTCGSTQGVSTVCF